MAITIIIRAIQDVRASKVNDNYTHIRKYVMKGKTYGINQVWHGMNPPHKGAFIFYVE